MDQKNYSYKLLLFSLMIILTPVITKSQILLIRTPGTTMTHKKVTKILLDEMKLPEKILIQRAQQKCQITRSDQRKFDLVVCIKKNGKLEFPVYKKTILKNSYKAFF
jgi:hypothetical protein